MRFAKTRLRMARLLAAGIRTSHDLAQEIWGQPDTDAGFPVTRESAMRQSAVYSCVRILSEDIAALPLKLYQPLARGRQVVASHWLVDLIKQPNDWQTGFEFREMEQSHLELQGNFFGLKTIVKGEVVEILPTSPSRWSVKMLPGWKIEYKFTWPDGIARVIPTDSVYHVRGLTIDGITGVSPIQYQRETIGFGQALQKYGSTLFRNGAHVGGVIEHPKTLSDPAAKHLRESFEEKYSGLDNVAKTVLLEEGAKFNATQMKADDAQFLESRKFSRAEIAGIYRVPPHFIADLDRATFSNIEQQSIDYVQKGLLPRVTRLEQRMARSLIPKGSDLYFKHSLDGLLRGDFASRMSGYQTAVLTGWMSRAEARELDEMNPAPDDAKLDEFLVPSNELLAATLDKKPAPDPAADPANPPAPKPKEKALRAI